MEDSYRFYGHWKQQRLFGYNRATSVDFSITVRTADGLGSGYAIRDVNDVSKLSTKAATEVAMQKALASVNARALEPGKYTVILEPTACGGSAAEYDAAAWMPVMPTKAGVF